MKAAVNHGILLIAAAVAVLLMTDMSTTSSSMVMVESFSFSTSSTRRMMPSEIYSENDHHNKKNALATSSMSIMAALCIGISIMPAYATAATPIDRISECKTTENKSCVSTSSVKNLKYFTSPWEFESSGVSSEEALARIKGLLNDSPGVEVDRVEVDVDQLSSEDKAEDGSISTTTTERKSYYVHATAKGDYLFEGEGNIEFLINKPDTNIVTFKATGYGANKGFFDNIRKKSGGVFTSSSGIGEDMEDALLGVGEYSKSTGGDGIIGQLKAFYGYQSGQGFEDVLLDDE